MKIGDETGLFDLACDIGESKDLKEELPHVLKKMEKIYERWNRQMVEPAWTEHWLA